MNCEGVATSVDSNGHIVAAAMTIDNSPGQDPFQLAGCTCHGFGHALGIPHYPVGSSSYGPCFPWTAYPTPTDWYLLRSWYDHRDHDGPPGV
jgi:hypothetical protein